MKIVLQITDLPKYSHIYHSLATDPNSTSPTYQPTSTKSMILDISSTKEYR